MKKYLSLIFIFFLLSLIFINIPFVFSNPDYEDFTTYEEEDDYDYINLVGKYHVDFLCIRNSRDAYLYFDCGIDFFTNFTHSIDIRVDNNFGIAMGYTWVLSNTLKNWRDMTIGNDDSIGVRFSAQNDFLSIVELDEGTQYTDDYVYSINTWYYLNIIKTDMNLTCNIYSDSERTILLDTLALTLHSNWSFRYIYAVCSYGIGNPQDSFNIDVENLEISVAPSLWHLTFYYNEGGFLRVDNVTIANGTENSYINGTIIELIALVEGNLTYGFINFSWDSNYNISNPSILIISSNLTIWCYFYSISEIIDEINYTAIALLISICLIIILAVIAKIKWR